jgi:hypothetical protein
MPCRPISPAGIAGSLVSARQVTCGVWLGPALIVATVAADAAVISYRHACELVSTHGEAGLTARLLPFPLDGLILAASTGPGPSGTRRARGPRTPPANARPWPAGAASDRWLAASAPRRTLARRTRRSSPVRQHQTASHGWWRQPARYPVILSDLQTAGTEENRFRPSASERYLVTPWPRTLLPATSSGGENVPTPPLPGDTVTIPPLTPLLPGRPMS